MSELHEHQANKKKNGLGTAALVLGIIGFVFAFIPFVNYGTGIIPLIGLVLGLAGLAGKGKKKGVATAGAVISGIALIWTIIFIVVYTSAFSHAVNNATTGSSSSSNTKTTAKTAKMNEVAPDGSFAFTVSGFKCGVPTVTDNSGYLSKSAQGQYCELSVSVKNTGNSAQMFDGSNVYLYNSNGQKYTYDSTATTYANPSNDTFLNTVNPGNTASGVVVFDVPKEQTPVTAELHESMFSGGVKVDLQ